MHTPKQKRKLRRFIVSKEIIMVILALASLVLLALEYFEHMTPQQIRYANIYEIMVAFIFMGEYIFELHHAKDKRHYMIHHWYFLIAAVPLPLEIFEAMRAVRLFRAVRLLKIFAHLSYEHNTHLFKLRIR